MIFLHKPTRFRSRPPASPASPSRPSVVRREQPKAEEPKGGERSQEAGEVLLFLIGFYDSCFLFLIGFYGIFFVFNGGFMIVVFCIFSGFMVGFKDFLRFSTFFFVCFVSS